MRIVRTYPALASVNLPRSAQILDVQPRPDLSQAPALVVSIDDADAETEQRRFAILDVGATIPLGAQFVASWRDKPENLAQRHGSIRCLFELVEDIPGDLPPEAVPHYRLLVRDGFEPVLAVEPGGPGRLTCWKAPDNVPPGQLSQEQAIAVATLQEYGYGSVVNA